MPKKMRKQRPIRPVGMMAAVAGRITGEISKLRQSISLWKSRLITGRFSSVYKLDSSRVNYELARQLYNNEHDEYKLGAWAAKPVINTCVGFMGVPRFRLEDEDAQKALDGFAGQHVSLMQQTHRDALRDGDCWVWLTREEEVDKELYPESDGTRLVYNIIPPEQIDKIIRDPLTGRPVEYILASDHEWVDEAGTIQKARVIQRVSAERRLTEVDGPVPPGVEPGEEPNPWGFLPIVQFSNERDSSAANGRSDLESIEPFMKAYHDVMLHAIQGSKLHSTPRLKLQLKDVARFLQNNFGVEDPAKFAREGKTINLDGHELLIFQDDEDAEFIEAQSAIGSAKDLLKLIFYCIIDVSETPELAFGVHMASSHASAKEQTPILIRRVARKREHFSESWQQLARIVLAMRAKAEGRRFETYEATLLWDEIDPRDGKEIAAELQSIVAALSQAYTYALISQESAVDFLARYIDTMTDFVGDSPEVPGERERIVRDRIRMSRLEDSQLAEHEKDLLDKALAELEGGGD